MRLLILTPQEDLMDRVSTCYYITTLKLAIGYVAHLSQQIRLYMMEMQ